MGFGYIFKKAWKDYKDNLNNILKANFWFVLFPFLLVFAFVIISLFCSGLILDIKNLILILINSQTFQSSTNAIQNTGLDKQISLSVFKIFIKALIIILISGLFTTISLFISTFGYLCTLSVKTKESFKALRKRVKPIYWKFMGLLLLLFLISIGLTLILMIVLFPLFFISSLLPFRHMFNILLEILVYLAIIFFMVRIIFSPFILISEKKSIIESLKASWNMTKGKWLNIFGHLLLLFALISLAGIVIELIAILFIYIYVPSISILGQMTDIGQILSIIGNIILIIGLFYFLYCFITYLIIIPFILIFLRNFYLDLKKKK